MLTARQQHAMDSLPPFEVAYYESCALLNQVLTPAQRLSRQKIVRLRLAALNQVREAAGLELETGPRLLTVDELLQPVAKAALSFEVAYEAQQRTTAHLQKAA